MTRTVLLLGYVWPESNASAAGVRDWALVRAFQHSQWKVIYASPSKTNSFSEKLNAEGIETKTVAANDSSFDSWIGGLRPDYVVYDRFVMEEQFGWRVRAHSPQTVQILDTQDLHFLRRAREKALQNGATLQRIFDAEIDLHTEDAFREIASIYRSDLTLVLSDFEFELLVKRFALEPSLLSWLPFSYPPPPEPRDFNEREHFSVIGNFRHPPNADGVRWLHEKIWPLIRRQLPHAEAHIYGAYPSREMMDLTDPKSGFIVKGPAQDQYETLSRYRVNLAPLRFGAGIKGKIADGWWCGTPAVTTPIGAEGMHGGLPFGGLVSSDAESFAEQAVRLHQDATLWREKQRDGLELIRQRFDEPKTAARLIDALELTRRELPGLRRRNFIGAMLSHHFHRSTVYFSKWIEAKNSPRGGTSGE